MLIGGCTEIPVALSRYTDRTLLDHTSILADTVLTRVGVLPPYAHRSIHSRLVDPSMSPNLFRWIFALFTGRTLRKHGTHDCN